MLGSRLMNKLVPNMSMEEYQAIPAMSAGMAVTMVEQCPLKAWMSSPFNPSYVREDKNHFDIGTAVHLAVLEPHLFAEQVVCHDFVEYRTNESKEIRDSAWAAGKTPLKPDEATLVKNLRNAVMSDVDAEPLLTQAGDAEVTLLWDWDGIPCKARVDRLSHDFKIALDLKTARSVEPRAMERAALEHGWHVRAVWYMSAIKAVTDVDARYCFLPVEKDPPYIVEVYEMEESALIRGEQLVGRALHLFAECQRTGKWPKYRSGSSKLRLPGYAEFRYAEREEMGEL